MTPKDKEISDKVRALLLDADDVGDVLSETDICRGCGSDQRRADGSSYYPCQCQNDE